MAGRLEEHGQRGCCSCHLRRAPPCERGPDTRGGARGAQLQESVSAQEGLEVRCASLEQGLSEATAELERVRGAGVGMADMARALKEAEAARTELLAEGQKLMGQKQQQEEVSRGLRRYRPYPACARLRRASIPYSGHYGGRDETCPVGTGVSESTLPK